MARRSYTDEFKLQALCMITKQGLSVAEAVCRLGVRDNLLRNWKKAYIRSVREITPDAVRVFDHVHMVKLFNDKLSVLHRRLYHEATSNRERKVL